LIIKPIQPLRAEPGSSTPDAIRRTVQPRGDIDVLQALGRVQDHPRSLHRPERQRDRTRAPLKLFPLLGGKLNPVRAGPRHDT
jgi:hypothetical protein